MAYCHEIGHLAVAQNNGACSIRKIDWAKVDAGEKGALDEVVAKNIFSKEKKQDKLEWIEAMHYSPDSKLLAVGSHDNKIYVTIKRLRKLIEPDYDKPRYIFRAKNGYYLNKNTKILMEQN